MEQEILEVDPDLEGVAHEVVDLPEETKELEITDDVADPKTVDSEKEEEQEQQEAEAEKTKPKKKRKRKTHQEMIDEALYHKHAALEQAAAEKAKSEILQQKLQEMEEKANKASDPQEELSALRKKRNEALEEDDMVTAFQLMDEINDLQSRKTERKPPVEPRREERPVDSDDGRPKQAPAAKSWEERNEWFYLPQNKHLAQEALYIQNELHQQGYGFTDMLYEELDRRLSESPDFDSVLKQPAKPRIAAPSRGGEPPNKPKPGQLTQHDLDALRKSLRGTNLDPNDPKVRAKYMKYRGRK